MATPGPLGPNLQGMDSLTAAMKTNIIPDQEYLLQVEISLLSSINVGHVREPIKNVLAEFVR